ncbi:preprotein translocase subunit SecD [Acaryochloris sp. 'Moss Beach']|uniref:preprotein translocase subunit SecD n=1 Tax=Acaryochloris sp. 'Moss Beach' TaxID=2740837 RepID=UPI001F4084D1|nr:preprotein translocase subunit SecD [Acaryochloris sp. 'Moss Beach']
MPYSLQSGIASALITIATTTHCADVDFLSQFPISIPSTVSSAKLCPFQGTELTLQMGKAYQDKISRGQAFDQVQTVLRERLLNLRQVVVGLVPLPPDQFLVQLPGQLDQRQAVEQITQRSHLTFRLQNPTTPQTESLLLQKIALQPKLAAKPSDPRQLEKQLAQIYKKLYGPPVLTDKNVISASYQVASVGNRWDVVLRFDAQGAEQFQQITKKVAGTQRPIGIFLDDQLLSEAIVSSQFAKTGIAGGAAVITGNFDLEMVKNLAFQLKEGSLPAPITVLKTEAVQTEQCSSSPQV